MSLRLDQLPGGPSSLAQRVARIERTLRERAAQLSAIVRRTDSSIAMRIDSTWLLLDQAGNTLVAEDIGGEGLGLPYLPIPFTAARYTDWPASTSATFEDVLRATIKRLQPYAYISIGHTADAAATTGEIQVYANNAQVGDTIAVTFSQVATTVGPFPLPGLYKAQVDLVVRVRRTGGAGAIRCTVLAASGIES